MDRTLDEFVGESGVGSAVASERGDGTDGDDGDREGTDDTGADREGTDGDGRDRNATDDAGESQAASGAGAAGAGASDRAGPTFEWTPAGGTCGRCGATVERRWDDDGALVCAECKAW